MKEIEFTKTDMNAITLGDSNYINNKGAKFYTEENYEKAVEYYRVAAAMGNVQAISNLGYCYLYGRSIEVSVSEAIAMFSIAASRDSVDAAYKLGDIYSRDKWGVMDKEMSVYYYRMAASLIISKDWEGRNAIVWIDGLQRYPSLCFALARELAPGGEMATNVELSYQFLKHAELGYMMELINGAEYYKEAYNKVVDLLGASCYDLVRTIYDQEFEDAYSSGDEEDVEVATADID